MWGQKLRKVKETPSILAGCQASRFQGAVPKTCRGPLFEPQTDLNPVGFPVLRLPWGSPMGSHFGVSLFEGALSGMV